MTDDLEDGKPGSLEAGKREFGSVFIADLRCELQLGRMKLDLSRLQMLGGPPRFLRLSCMPCAALKAKRAHLKPDTLIIAIEAGGEDKTVP
jgi:hypothetical protein